jgi:hypothetical protein
MGAGLCSIPLIAVEEAQVEILDGCDQIVAFL